MSLHQTLIRLTRDFGEIFPEGQDLTFTETRAVIRECEASWRNHGHCENPYPSGDVRFTVWAAHTITIFDRIKDKCSPIEGDFYVLPPAPVPECEKRFIQWEGEDLYV